MRKPLTKRQPEDKPTGETELYRKYRPQKFSEVVGQEEAISILKNKGKAGQMPHSILLHGPRGVGKTTIARIIARCLGCRSSDLLEINNADYTGVDIVRDIRRALYQSPLFGKCRVFVLDECHRLTSAAQSSLLKMIEEPPSHVYFILCTTDPDRLLDTIRDRCLPIRLQALPQEYILGILNNVCLKEGIRIKQSVLNKIAEYNTGSARGALVALDKVRALPSEKEQLAAIEQATIEAQVISLARVLSKEGSSWKDVTSVLRTLEKEDPEQIRYIVLGYAKTMLLNAGSVRGFAMINAFRDNFYDCKFAGVIAACAQVVSQD